MDVEFGCSSLFCLSLHFSMIFQASSLLNMSQCACVLFVVFGGIHHFVMCLCRGNVFVCVLCVCLVCCECVGIFKNGSDLESDVFMCVGLLGVLFVFLRLWVSVSVCVCVCLCVCVWKPHVSNLCLLHFFVLFWLHVFLSLFRFVFFFG